MTALAARTGLVSLRRYGHSWEVALGTRKMMVKDSRGMGYLAILVANPGFEIAAVELAGQPGSAQARALDSAGSSDPLLDEAAKRAYRRRLDELSADIEEHEDNHDLVNAERARMERDWLIEQLASAAGLHGSGRSFATASERARISVGKAIRRAIGHIGEADAVMGQELVRTVKTGHRCSYLPPPCWGAAGKARRV